MISIRGKRAVITGAASGFGRSLALALADRGCRIGIADINVEGALATLEMVEKRKGSGEIYPLDVVKPEEVEAMADHFFKSWGGVDLLVNNAGVAVVGIVGEIPLENWKRVIDINFWGMVYGCHSFIPRMKAQGSGYILNMASAAGLLSMMEMAPYNTSKAAVISLSETLKTELAPHGIGVTVLCPMFFKTNLLESMTYTNAFEESLSRVCFDQATLSSDQVAEAAIQAVEREKLYCVPQLSGRTHWYQKRLSPSLYYGQMSLLNRRGWARPLLLWLGRHGLM